MRQEGRPAHDHELLDETFAAHAETGVRIHDEWTPALPHIFKVDDDASLKSGFSGFEEERAVSSFGSLPHRRLMERLPRELVERAARTGYAPVQSGRVSWDKAGGYFCPLAHRRRGAAVSAKDRGVLRQGERMPFPRQKGYEVKRPDESCWRKPLRRLPIRSSL